MPSSGSNCLLFLATVAVCIYGEKALAALKTKVKSELRTKAEQEIIILSPPSPSSSSTDNPQPQPSSNVKVLLIIFPGAFLEPTDYVAIAKVVQQQASLCGIQLTVGIGILLFTASSQTKWAYDDKNDMFNSNPNTEAMMRITKRVQEKAEESLDSAGTKQKFHHTFVWGHSLGGNAAIQTAYPSSITGLILYGGSWSLYSNKQPQDLISFPRPTLTMVGERDGFLRPWQLAAETQHQQDDMERRTLATTSSYLVISGKEENIQRRALIQKPIVILAALNHMHMSLGITPPITSRSGRSDGWSSVSLEQAHLRLGQVVVDFMHVHCTAAIAAAAAAAAASVPQDNNNIKVEESENRLLQHVQSTRQYLRPFMELSNPIYTSRFVQDVQLQLLPLAPALTILAEWRRDPKDFLYSKPKFHPQESQLWIQVTEQEHLTIKICNVAQLSKTIAIKAKSQDLILSATMMSNSEQYQEESEESPPPPPSPSVMQINQETFDAVLNEVVTFDERQRYFLHGKKLHFGPDILVESPPQWVETPLAVTKQRQEEESNVVAAEKTTIEYYYILQSPYATTPTSIPPPFGGMFYFKPMSPSQAYEWIVFDSFK
jgi:hypothetical protein